MGQGKKGQLHYCRVCGEIFEATKEASAHHQTRKHQRINSRGDADPHYYITPLDRMCDSSCSALQQPEEVTSGKQMYGNIARPKRTKKESAALHAQYMKAFPPEEGDSDYDPNEPF